jgi:regulator of sigma E protease
MDIIIMAAQLLLALSILVGMHELGHMLTAKYFGMRVEKFSIGFPPKIFSFRKGDTEYQLGSIPLGGFVKITGMIDESLDSEAMKQEPKPFEFRSKPAWQRLIVMMGGIIVNFLLGIFIYICVLWYYGETYIPKDEVNKNGIVAFELAEKLGMKTGDKILKVNGHDFEKFPQDILTPEMLLAGNSYYTVQRGHDTLQIRIPDSFISEFSSGKKAFLDAAYPFAVKRVVEGSNAEKGGLKGGDKILTVNNSKVTYFHELQKLLRENKNKKVAVEVQRGGAVQTLNLQVDTSGRVGFEPELLLKSALDKYSVAEAAQLGTQKALSTITNTIKAFGEMISGRLNASESVAGPVGIAKEFGAIWIWEKFWILTASLSMILAFMNFLPIPALDGGHVMFLTYEMVAGRKPSDKFLENAQKVGMAMLLTLMVFVLGNDIWKIFK